MWVELPISKIGLQPSIIKEIKDIMKRILKNFKKGVDLWQVMSYTYLSQQRTERH